MTGGKMQLATSLLNGTRKMVKEEAVYTGVSPPGAMPPPSPVHPPRSDEKDPAADKSEPIAFKPSGFYKSRSGSSAAKKRPPRCLEETGVNSTEWLHTSKSRILDPEPDSPESSPERPRINREKSVYQYVSRHTGKAGRSYRTVFDDPQDKLVPYKFKNRNTPRPKVALFSSSHRVPQPSNDKDCDPYDKYSDEEEDEKENTNLSQRANHQRSPTLRSSLLSKPAPRPAPVNKRLRLEGAKGTSNGHISDDADEVPPLSPPSRFIREYPSAQKKARVISSPQHIKLRPRPGLAPPSSRTDLDSQYSSGVGLGIGPDVIGFPNLGNTCYLNAGLQALLSLSSFTDEMLYMSKHGSGATGGHKFGALVTNLLDLVKSKRRCNESGVRRALNGVKYALEAIDRNFLGAQMQDANEFLIRVLDSIKDDIDRVLGSEKDKKAGSEDARKEDESGTIFEDPPDKLGSGKGTENEKEAGPEATDDKGTEEEVTGNPIKNNFGFQMLNTYQCISCEKVVTSRQDYFSMFLDIPTHGVCGDSPGLPSRPTLFSALSNYMAPQEVDYKCDACQCQRSRLTSVFNCIPRVLILQLKRYAFDSGSKKINTVVAIPLSLALDTFVTADFCGPVRWVNPVLTPAVTPAQSPVKLNRGGDLEDDDEMKRVLQLSLEEQADSQRKEEEDVKKAIELSLNGEVPQPSYASPSSSPSPSPIPISVCDGKLDYRLVGIVCHSGVDSSSGHYVADVFDLSRQKWFYYNDLTVREVEEKNILGKDSQETGYIFFYMWRELFDTLKSSQQT